MRLKNTLLATQILLALSLTGCASLNEALNSQETQAAKQSTCPATTPEQMAQQQKALDQNPIYLILAGEMAGQARDIPEAARFYGDAAQNSTDPALLARATSIALLAKNYRLTAQLAEKWSKAEPDSAKAAAALTISNIQLGNTAAADAALDNWLQDDTRSKASVFSELGEYLSKDVPDHIALDYSEHIAQRYNNDINAQILLARLALKFQQPLKAIVAARRAVELDNKNRSAQELLIISLNASGNSKGVINALDDARKAFPNDVRFTSALIEAQIRSGHAHRAGQLLQEVLNRPISEPDILRNLALFSLQIHRPVLAEKSLLKLKKLPGERDEAELLLGRLALHSGDMKKAIVHLKRVSASSSRYVEARILLAEVLTETAGLSAGLNSLDQVDVNPQSSELDVADLQRLTLAKAGLLQSHGQYQKALDVLNHGLTLWPDANDLKLQQALLLFNLNRPKDAKLVLREIIANDPENAQALNALGFTLVEENHSLDEARKLIQRALELDPENSAYIDSLGWYFFRVGELDKAEKTLSKAFRNMPDPEVGAHLGTVLWHQKRYDDARKVWKKSLELGPNSAPLNRVVKQYAPELLKQKPH